MNFFGRTRTRVERDHAFISEDGHVPAPLPGWTNSSAIVLISPVMGARFSMYFADMQAGGTAGMPLEGVQRFIYVLDGQLEFSAGARSAVMTSGWYAYIPAGTSHQLIAAAESRIVVFEKRFEPQTNNTAAPQPELIVAHEQEKQSAAFLGDKNAQLKSLLPDEMGYDMAVNLFRFKPGTPLPFVETHIMEHGMLMLQGGGVYRLAEQWYPIKAGDVLWMGSYCPQWFGALGKEDSAYLYYKDVNRDPLNPGAK